MRRIGVRGLILILILTVALGGYAIGPAVSEPQQLTTKKAKRLFFTKRKTRKLFITKRRANARFLRHAGAIRLNLHPADWEREDLTSLSISDGGATFSAPGIAPNEDAILPIAIPARLYGRGLRIAGLEYCYDTVSNSRIDSARFRRLTATASDPNPGATILFGDETNRDDATCRTIGPPTPVPVGLDDSFAFNLQVDFQGAGSFVTTRTTLILVP